MPKSLSRLKHEESKPNSELQVRSQKKIEHNPEEIGSLQDFCRVAKILQPVEFCNLQNLAGCEFSQPTSSCVLFDPRLTSFCDFSNFSLHVLWVLRVFVYFFLFKHYISSNKIL